MKKIVVLILFIMLVGCTTTNKTPDLTQVTDDVEEDVVTDSEPNVEEYKTEVQYRLVETTQTDGSGNVLSSIKTNYNEDVVRGMTVDGVVRTYNVTMDKFGNVVYEVDNIFGTEKFYTYDENNVLIKVDEYFMESEEAFNSEEYTYTFDENGNIIMKETTAVIEGKVTELLTQKYNEDNNLLLAELVIYGNDSDTIRVIEYEYFEDKYRESYSTEYGSGEYMYNYQDQVLSHTYTYNDEYLIEEISTYNSGLLIETVTTTNYLDGKNFNVVTENYSYSEDGLTQYLEQVISSEEGESRDKFEFVHDEYGNVVEKIIYADESTISNVVKYTYEPYEVLVKE